MLYLLDRPHEVTTFNLTFLIPAKSIRLSRFLLSFTLNSSIFARLVSLDLDTKLTVVRVLFTMLKVGQVAFIVHVAGLTVNY